MTITIKGRKALAWAYAYGRALQSGKSTIYDYYKRPSPAKVAAYNEIHDYAIRNGYRNCIVISGNRFRFSVGYNNGHELIIETDQNTYRIVIDSNVLLHYINGDF